LKFQAVAQKTAKDARGLLYFAAPGTTDNRGGSDNSTTGEISRVKLQSNDHHQQSNIQILQAGYPSCRPTNAVKAL